MAAKENRRHGIRRLDRGMSCREKRATSSAYLWKNSFLTVYRSSAGSSQHCLLFRYRTPPTQGGVFQSSQERHYSWRSQQRACRIHTLEGREDRNVHPV